MTGKVGLPSARSSPTFLPMTAFSPLAYPVRLHALLAARYPGQTFTVLNEGVGGEGMFVGFVLVPKEGESQKKVSEHVRNDLV